MVSSTTKLLGNTQNMMVGMGGLMLGAGALGLMGEILKK
jgi:hypothetical protein